MGARGINSYWSGIGIARGYSRRYFRFAQAKEVDVRLVAAARIIAAILSIAAIEDCFVALRIFYSDISINAQVSMPKYTMTI